jgi:hypothetical protein
MKRIVLSVLLVCFSGFRAAPQATANMTVTWSTCTSTSSDSNCTGIMLLTITLKDGTVIGPYIATKATEEMISAPVWTVKETLECP